MPVAINTPVHTSSHSIDRVLQAGLPVVLLFWRQECTPCRELDPIVHWLADDYAGKVIFAQVDADAEAELVRRYAVDRVPALVFVKDGRVVGTGFGSPPEADLRRWCEYLIHGGPQPAVPSGPAVPLRPEARPKATADGTGKPLTLTDANFNEVIQGDLPVLVDFWAPWCGPCRMVAPAVEELAKEFNGRLIVGKLNVDENPQTARRYGIMSIPTLMIFRRGKVADQVVGALPAAMLRQRVLPHVA
ncbi:MAG: thioredoxin [Caldilineae bacterium]|nr:MAG: thioredoxin [Caldilineae bacterium]